MRCNRCGKSGMRLSVNQQGLCDTCQTIVQLESNNYTLSQQIAYLQQTIAQIKNSNYTLSKRVTCLQNALNSIGFTEYTQTKAAIDKMNADMAEMNIEINRLSEKESTLTVSCEKLEKQVKAYTHKLDKQKSLYKSVAYAINEFRPISEFCEQELQAVTTVSLPFHCMDIRDLRKSFKRNEKQIDSLLEQYEARYTTKAYKSLYHLMILSLRAELQNILYALKYEKLDDAIEQVKRMTSKYLAIVSDGNQNIAGTMTRFVGEIEYLFIEAIKIEYNYYVKKEQARQEQLAIREQMRQEAEERKALEEERQRVENEEKKYQNEMKKIQAQMDNATDGEKEQLRSRILELQCQLTEVFVKKESITKLQNGKAGNIYIISNLGSFGENVFKIGMTRRLDPQERVDELGSASVPFKFDVHSFIFSDDAVALEDKLHKLLDEKRLNKVNLRKEFFYSSVDELEHIVNEIDPTASFTRTMAAEDYRQSISSGENYISLSDSNIDEDDDDDE